MSLKVDTEKPDEFGLSYTFDSQGQFQVLETQTHDRGVPSLIGYFSACDFPERQIYREFRIKFFGNPNLAETEYEDG